MRKVVRQHHVRQGFDSGRIEFAALNELLRSVRGLCRVKYDTAVLRIRRDSERGRGQYCCEKDSLHDSPCRVSVLVRVDGEGRLWKLVSVWRQ
jgi:hypothetical protein